MANSGSKRLKVDVEKNVTVIGAGRLGLCWGLCVEKAGFAVKAVDIFPSYVEAINTKTLTSQEPRLMEMLQASTRLEATLSLAEGVAFSPYLFVFVQTPSSGNDQHYDHTHLNNVLTQLNTLKVCDKHIVICCTVMPGYCDLIAPSLLGDCTNVTVSYSPEFIAQGAIIQGTLNPDIALIGEGSAAAGDMMERVTKAYVANSGSLQIYRLSPGSAEIAKLALNSFVTLKIAFANFVGDLADAAEARRQRYAPEAERGLASRKVDKLDIAQAIGGDSRVGLKCFLPGYGFGGPCFPRDGRALAEVAKQVSTPQVPLDAGIAQIQATSNLAHAHFQARRLIERANEMVLVQQAKKPGNGGGGGGGRASASSSSSSPPHCTVVFDDVAFKPGCPVPIVLESQKLVVAQYVREHSSHAVAIREPREDLLNAVRKDYGLRFEYWRLPPTELPKGVDRACCLVADDELLPERAGKRYYVPLNSNRDEIVGAAAPVGQASPGADHQAVPASELRGEGRASLPTTFR